MKIGAYALVSINQENTSYNQWSNVRHFQVPEPKWVTQKPSEKYQYCPRLVDHENWKCAKRRVEFRNCIYRAQIWSKVTIFQTKSELSVCLYLQNAQKEVQSQV